MKISRLSDLLTRECQNGLIRSPVNLLTETYQQKNMGGEAKSTIKEMPRTVVQRRKLPAM